MFRFRLLFWNGARFRLRRACGPPPALTQAGGEVFVANWFLRGAPVSRKVPVPEGRMKRHKVDSPVPTGLETATTPHNPAMNCWAIFVCPVRDTRRRTKANRK